MSIPAGDVEVDDEGAVTGSGLAFDLYTARIAALDAYVSSHGQTPLPASQRVSELRWYASEATVYAEIFAPYLTPP